MSNSDLALYTISFQLEGMKVPGKLEGVGNRHVTFQYYLDPTDQETATKAWYAHLDAMLGQEVMTKIRTFAEQQGV